MNTVLKYPGSKWSMVDWIIDLFPKDYEKMTYLEPFFGSGAVFFNKQRSKIETLNDVDDQVVNLFRVIRENPDELLRKINLTPWSRTEYKQSYGPKTGDSLEDARRFMVRTWMAIGTKTSDITGWSNNQKPVDSGISRWCKLDQNMMIASKRLQHDKCNLVQIENMEALKLIERYNRPYVFIYADPPYPISTRSKRIYKHEMTDDDHIRLLEVLTMHTGPVMISTYKNALYDNMLKGWNVEQITVQTEMGGSAIETVYMNYVPHASQMKMDFRSTT